MAVPPASDPDFPSALVQLGDCKHLIREKGLKVLVGLLERDAVQHEALREGIESLMTADNWEKKLGGLLAGKVYIPVCSNISYLTELQEAAMRLLEDGEVRVRLAVGDCLLALAKRQGLPVYEACGPRVLQSIEDNFDRDTSKDSADADGDADDAGDVGAAHLAAPGERSSGAPASLQRSSSATSTGSSGSLVGELLQGSYKRAVPGRGEMRHGTEGWKCLETSMKALQSLVEGVGPAIKPHLDTRLRSLLYKALHHPNRFVRETGHFTMCTVCEALRGPELAAIAPEVAERLADGMSDNWSQVRYAACVSTRSFMEWIGDEYRPQVMALLLPPMCLNRYYVAEGVRLYAQQTWQRIMGDNGRAAVAQHIDPVVAFYVAQSKANNHAVREAACACIAELMEKVDRAAVAPHVPTLFKALVTCFKDMSWPVRDAACTAAGRCVLAYPEEMRPWAGQFLGLWLAHLADNIPTVRENSAVALGKALRVYPAEVLPQLLAALEDMLLRAQEQPAESSRYTGLEQTTRFGVAARKARDNDPVVHSDQEMFSCGSLMARFSTSYLIRSDGCMDHGFSRDKEPWEVSDGAVYLLREVALAQPEAVTPKHMEGLVVLGSLSTFQHAFSLHETLWKALPKIAQAIGKQRFKPHLAALLQPLSADLSCGHQLAESAARQCLESLRTWIGPKIIAGYMPGAC